MHSKIEKKRKPSSSTSGVGRATKEDEELNGL